MEFNGKTILITGGSKGLGACLGEKLAAKGSNIILFARNEENLKKVCKKIQDNGGNANYFVGDVTKSADIDKLYDFVIDKFGIIDILINNAGILNSNGFDNSYDTFQKIMDINVNGYMRMLIKFFPIIGREMKIKKKTVKSGMIIIISSLSAILIPPPLQFYGISKHTTRAISIALRQHLLFKGLKNIKVLNVNPPQFDTEIYNGSGLEDWVNGAKDKGWMFSTEKIANDIIKAAIKEKQELNMTIFGKISAFGMKYFPRMMYYFTRKQYK